MLRPGFGNSTTGQLVFLTVLCASLYFFDLGGRDLWDIDEGMHAVIAKNMLLTGDWVTPIFNGEAFLDKPPLFNWLTALSFLVFGTTEFAARLPAALAGLGTVLVTYGLARRLYGKATGFIAGIVLATSLEMIIVSRIVQYDAPFIFFSTLAMYFYVRSTEDAENSRASVLLFYGAAGLAALTKGPIGLFIPLVVIGAHSLITRRRRYISQFVSPLGLLTFAAVVVPWYVLMERANPGYLYYFAVHQHFANLIGGSGIMQPRHAEPFYYFVPVLFAGLLPWSLLLPQAIARAMTKDRSAEALFLVCWVACIFLGFSIAASKLSTYILPMFPGAAILVARYWQESMWEPLKDARRGLLLGCAALTLVLSISAAYVIVEDPWAYWEFRSGIIWKRFELFMVLMTVLVVIIGALAWTKRQRAAFVGMSLFSPILIAYVSIALVPGIDAYRGAKSIAQDIDTMLAPGEKLYSAGQLLDSAMFYTGREAVKLQSEAELHDYLDTEERRFVIVRSRARSSDAAFKGDYHVLKVVGNKAIVSNQPLTAASAESAVQPD